MATKGDIEREFSKFCRVKRVHLVVWRLGIVVVAVVVVVVADLFPIQFRKQAATDGKYW